MSDGYIVHKFPIAIIYHQTCIEQDKSEKSFFNIDARGLRGEKSGQTIANNSSELEKTLKQLNTDNRHLLVENRIPFVEKCYNAILLECRNGLIINRYRPLNKDEISNFVKQLLIQD